MFPIDYLLCDFVVSTINYVNKVFKENISFIQVKDVFSLPFIFEQIFHLYLWGLYLVSWAERKACVCVQVES